MQPISVPSAQNLSVIPPKPQPTTMNLRGLPNMHVCTHTYKCMHLHIYITNLYLYDQLQFTKCSINTFYSKSQRARLFLHLAVANLPWVLRQCIPHYHRFYRNESILWSAQFISSLKGAYLKETDLPNPRLSFFLAKKDSFP